MVGLFAVPFGVRGRASATTTRSGIVNGIPSLCHCSVLTRPPRKK